MNFKTPKQVIWVKVNGDITEGLLTNDMTKVPTEFHPQAVGAVIPGYKRLFCLARGHWISLYTRNILAV